MDSYILKEKSRNMINLLSKSPETFEKLNNQLKMLLTEQRHQRQDLATIKRQLHTIINSLNLQKQVDDYFEMDAGNGIKDTAQDGTL